MGPDGLFGVVLLAAILRLRRRLRRFIVSREDVYKRQVYERETREIVRVLQANASDVMPTMDLTSYQEKLALLESNFEINRQRIAEKVKEPSKTVSLEDTDTLLLEIGAIIDEINKQIKANNDVVSAKRSRCV